MCKNLTHLQKTLISLYLSSKKLPISELAERFQTTNTQMYNLIQMGADIYEINIKECEDLMEIFNLIPLKEYS